MLNKMPVELECHIPGCDYNGHREDAHGFGGVGVVTANGGNLKVLLDDDGRVEVLHDGSGDAQLHGNGHDLQTCGVLGAACDGGRWRCSGVQQERGHAGLVEDRHSS